MVDETHFAFSNKKKKLRMIISIIGSGNTATVLGKLSKENNHVINEVVGRNKIAVQQLSEKLNANACAEILQLNKNSDLYIIAVKDDAVANVSEQLNLNNKIVVHTCGSVPMNVLANTSVHYGVLYPLQSLRKELNYSPVIPFLIDSNNDFVRRTIFNFASSISGSVIYANDETRLHYHLAAAIVSNFSNHLFALAQDYCYANKTDFSLLLPLIEETVNRVHYYDAGMMQTGPAMRGDETIIQKHLQLLNEFPQLRNMYEVISKSIQQYYLNKKS
jgi:predicted short-subunit dehydrogenase-like oxidoreductase (DUF2520 family)